MFNTSRFDYLCSATNPIIISKKEITEIKEVHKVYSEEKCSRKWSRWPLVKEEVELTYCIEVFCNFLTVDSCMVSLWPSSSYACVCVCSCWRGRLKPVSGALRWPPWSSSWLRHARSVTVGESRPPRARLRSGRCSRASLMLRTPATGSGASWKHSSASQSLCRPCMVHEWMEEISFRIVSCWASWFNISSKSKHRNGSEKGDKTGKPFTVLSLFSEPLLDGWLTLVKGQLQCNFILAKLVINK